MTHSEVFLLGGRSHRQGMERPGYFLIAGWIWLTEVGMPLRKKQVLMEQPAFSLEAGWRISRNGRLDISMDNTKKENS